MSSSRIERCYNIAELRKLAKRNMPAPMFHYIDGAADDAWTLRRNTAAFDACELLPRALVDVSTTDMSTTLFGQRIDWPYLKALALGVAALRDIDSSFVRRVGASWAT